MSRPISIASGVVWCVLALGSLQCGEPTVTPSATLTAVILTPASVSLPTGSTRQFSVSGVWSDGGTAAPAVTYSATGGTVTASGLYTAGSTTGSYRVIATEQGGTLADTCAVTITAATLTQLVLAPPTVSLPAGVTQQFTVSGVWSNGSTATPVVTYGATGGSITAGGLYTAGNTPGTYRVIATQQGGTLADTSAVTVTAATLTQVILSPPSATVSTGSTQQFSVSGVWSDGGNAIPPVSYTATGGTITAGGLYTAGNTTGNYRVISTQQGGTLADTSTVVVTASTATVLFQEGFEDSNAGARGWFDLAGAWPLSSTEHAPGASTHSLEWHFGVGVVSPVNGGGRHDFTPSDGVYLSYYVKQSANWGGSGATYDPHMFYILTNVDVPVPGGAPGLSRTHLTLYNELNYVTGSGGSRAHAAMQDALNINPAYLNQDVSPGHSPTTEDRAIAGYNGQPESGFAYWDTYLSGGLYFNGKWWASNFPAPGTLVMTDATKNSWHHVETYYQLNTIVGGIGQRDGVLQYWFDGMLLVDRHDIYYRTGKYPNMKFTQFIMGPYMSPNGGTGSPINQYMWIDDLLLATGKP
jgi:hypothetical protein